MGESSEAFWGCSDRGGRCDILGTPSPRWPLRFWNDLDIPSREIISSAVLKKTNKQGKIGKWNPILMGMQLLGHRGSAPHIRGTPHPPTFRWFLSYVNVPPPVPVSDAVANGEGAGFDTSSSTQPRLSPTVTLQLSCQWEGRGLDIIPGTRNRYQRAPRLLSFHLWAIWMTAAVKLKLKFKKQLIWLRGWPAVWRPPPMLQPLTC